MTIYIYSFCVSELSLIIINKSGFTTSVKSPQAFLDLDANFPEL